MIISVYFFSRATARNLILTKSSIRMSKAMQWGKSVPATKRNYLRMYEVISEVGNVNPAL